MGRDAFYSQALGGDPDYVVGCPLRFFLVTILTSSGELVAEARVVTVRWDPGQRTSMPFSDAERTQLTAAMTPGEGSV